ncbi:MAG: hypothetical protein AABX07_02215, partial [Nanoarchaeota archaeon]
ENGACIGKIKSCSDGTPIGKCSLYSRRYCNEKGEIELDNYEQCGCPYSLMNIINNTCENKIISSPVYNCTICQGLCRIEDPNYLSICTEDDRYARVEKTAIFWEVYAKECKSDLDCSSTSDPTKCLGNHCLIDLFDKPEGLPIKVTPIYPFSVKIGESFNLTLEITNLGVEDRKITIDYVRLTFNNEDYLPVDYNQSKQIKSNSKDRFVIKFLPQNEESNMAYISFNIKDEKTGKEIWYDTLNIGGRETLSYHPLIIYDPISEAECGEYKYNKEKAVCINSVLYPTDLRFRSCQSNSDCSSDYGAICINYNCLRPSIGLPNAPNLNKKYKVGIVPIFVYENDSWYKSESVKEYNRIVNLSRDSSDWFNKERAFWEAKNNFSVGYEFYNSCALTKKQYLDVLNDCTPHQLKECEEKTLIKCNLNKSKYDIIGMTYNEDPNMGMDEIYAKENQLGYAGGAGQNFGSILFGAKEMSVLIHETLHSFGEIDLKENHFYQEGDCNLFASFWNDFENYPHLCNFEAKMIGWKD